MGESGTVERVGCQQDGRQEVFDWKIKDFSENQEPYCSPKFYSRGHLWHLQLDIRVQYVYIWLYLWSEDPRQAVDVQSSLGIRSASGKTEMEETHSIKEIKGWACVSVNEMKRSELFGRREELFPLGVLTVRVTLEGKIEAKVAYQEKRNSCLVDGSPRSDAQFGQRNDPSDAGRRPHTTEQTGTVERVGCQQDCRQEVFDWKIKDFSENQCLYRSPQFRFWGHTWYLQLESCVRSVDIWLYLWFEDRRHAVDFQSSLGIRSASGKTEMEETRSIKEIRHWVLVSSRIMKTSEFFGRREKLFPLGVITIRATFEGKIEAKGTERVLQDIGKMWPSDDLSDVVFRVGAVEFKAHRAILSARIPALGAIFRHDTAEKASGVVTIEDCEPAVFEQLLHYVYKGAPREVTAENACPLFTLADKYLLSEVKTLCVRYMADTLSMDTFFSTVTLALMHSEDELLEAAVDLFSRNMLDILQSVQWKTFLRDNLTWANEILIRAEKIRQEKKT